MKREVLGRFHVARTALVLGIPIPQDLQKHEVAPCQIHAVTCFLCVGNTAFCTLPLRASMVLIAVVFGICSQFSKPTWRLLGMENNLIVVLMPLDFIPSVNQAEPCPSQLLSFILGHDKYLQC